MSKLSFNINTVKARTAVMRTPPAPVSLTAKQQAIYDAVNGGNWGCQDSSVRALVQAITGVNCKKQGEQEFIQGGMIVYNDEVVMIRRIDSDGDAQILTSTGHDYTDDGAGTCYINSDSTWRAATDEEIDQFFA